METMKAILTRRSIRKYKAKAITENQLNEIIKAAMYAPSAFNNQPWQFIAVDKKEILGEIFKIIPHAEMLQQAAAAIIVCGDKNLEENINLIVLDCSAAVQNALLAIHDLGLGAVWISAYPVEEAMTGLKNFFNLPEYIVPIALLSIGYPDEAVTAEERFKTEKIHFNNW
ncbi:MAG: nitroreductase family protein [Ignavibacteriaceae bacterium]